MKLLFISQGDQSSLARLLREQGYAVVLTISDLELVVPSILQSRPHAVVVIGRAGDVFVEQAGEIASDVPDQRSVLHRPGDTFEMLLRQLAEVRKQVEGYKQRPIADQRILFFDPAFDSRTSENEVSAPLPEHATLLVEQDKLLVLLAQAVEHHHAASRYRDEVQQWTVHDTREIACRMTNGCYIAASFAQELVGRWLAVLAHYVPGVDRCYLPTPGDAIHEASWVYDGATAEAQYAFACADQLGFTKNLREPLRSLLSQKLANGEDNLVLHLALALTGASALLQEMTGAHVASMSRYLENDTEKLSHYLNGRNARRQHQLMCELWNLSLLRDYPQLAVKTISDFRRGRRSATRFAAPSFLEILAQGQGGQT